MQDCQDPLTEVLDVFPLPVKFAGRLALSAPWGISVPKDTSLVCLVGSGGCWLTGSGLDKPLAVAPGDLLLLAPEGEHQLRDSFESPVVSIHEVLECSHREAGLTVVNGDCSHRTELTASVLEIRDVRSHPLYSVLPPSLRLTPEDQRPEIERTLQAIESELSTSRPGGQAVARRLMEALSTQIARRHLGAATGIDAGVMRGMMHRDIGSTLSQIHVQPDQPWTVASLASHALMSRSSFSAIFSEVLGVPPLQYVREHRMRMASHLLQDPSLGLKEIATQIGYQSVSAFSKAFKRYSGLSPKDYRRGTPNAVYKGPPRRRAASEAT